jgi:hypothetical protein
MRRALFLATVLLTLGVVSGVNAAEEVPVYSKVKKIKIEGKAYIHYDASLLKKDNYHSAFKITRNYLEVRGYFNDKDYFRTTLDVKQDTDVDKGSYVVRLKYAYLYLHGILPYTGVELGMAHRPWIDWEEHHGWLHRDIEKTFVESSGGAHLLNSADLGANFKGKNGIASWEVGIFNGEGYHEVEDSKHFGKSIEARLSLSPVKGFTISGHTVHSFDHKDKNYDEHIYQIHAVYNTPLFLVAGQYVLEKQTNGSDKTGKGYSVNCDLKLKEIAGLNGGVLARYDHWDPDDSTSNDERDQFIYGVFYHLNKHVKLSLVHERIIDKTDEETASTLMAVARIKW